MADKPSPTAKVTPMEQKGEESRDAEGTEKKKELKGKDLRHQSMAENQKTKARGMGAAGAMGGVAAQAKNLNNMTANRGYVLLPGSL